jgi:hypothetical protein
LLQPSADDDSAPLDLLKDLQTLKSLRGADSQDRDPAAVLTFVKGMFESISTSLTSLQTSYQEGDLVSTGAKMRKLAGNFPNSKMFKDVKQLSGSEMPDVLYGDIEADDYTFFNELDSLSWDDVPDSQLGSSMKPEIFDPIVDFTQDVVNTLDNIDVTKLARSTSKKKKQTNIHLKSGGQESEPRPKMDRFFNNIGATFDKPLFEFDSVNYGSGGNSEFNANFINHFTNPKVIQQNSGTKFMRRGLTMTDPKTFISPQHHEIVMAKHKLRRNAIGEVCLPRCEVSDDGCICAQLFNCVKRISEYDLAM